MIIRDAPPMEDVSNHELEWRKRFQDRLIGNVDAIVRDHPRSHQTRLGPSEVGSPCERKLAYRMLEPERKAILDRTGFSGWMAFIGTCVHARLEEGFQHIAAGDLATANEDDIGAWLTEHKVTIIENLDGTSDLLCILDDGTVVDWKIVGDNTLKKVRGSAGPGTKYRAQIHMYAKGYTNEGRKIKRVCIAFLPRNGELDSAHLFFERYRGDVADWAIRRLLKIEHAVEVSGNQALEFLSTADDYCRGCPFFTPRMPKPFDITQGCPGHSAVISAQAPEKERRPGVEGFLEGRH